jgi:hypothetical protein
MDHSATRLRLEAYIWPGASFLQLKGFYITAKRQEGDPRSARLVNGVQALAPS